MTKNKNKHKSNLDFKVMSFFFKIRDFFKSPQKKIRNARIKEGDYILDYGCGPGSYTFVAAEKIGSKGKIYAADIHSLALRKVRKKAKKRALKNIETIQTECNTGLDDKSIDIVLCFDVLHDIPNKADIINEFHRVLKTNAVLSFDDHHSEEKEIMNYITSGGLFKPSEKHDKQFNFIKVGV